MLEARLIDTLDESMDLMPLPLLKLLRNSADGCTKDASKLSILSYLKPFPAALDFPDF
jgi:hypothetical protein